MYYVRITDCPDLVLDRKCRSCTTGQWQAGFAGKYIGNRHIIKTHRPHLATVPGAGFSYPVTVKTIYLFYLFIMKIVHRVQVKRKQIQTEKKTQKYRHTHKKKNQ